MELRHLKYFYEVAVEMNFTRAAENLSIAQPPLSRQIKDLEEELGVSLFVRRPHYLALTPEGEILKQYAAQVLSLVDKSIETMKEMGEGINGTLYIATVESYAMRVMAGIINDFKVKYPLIQYNMWTGGTDDIVTRVKNGLCDVAIVQDIRNRDEVECYTIYREPWTVLIPADNPLSLTESDVVSPMDLLPYDLLIPIRSQRLEEVNKWFVDSDEKPRIRCRYNNLQAAYELTRGSVGIAVFPGDARNTLEAQGDVKIKLINSPDAASSFTLIYSRNRSMTHVVREFINFTKHGSSRYAGARR